MQLAINMSPRRWHSNTYYYTHHLERNTLIRHKFKQFHCNKKKIISFCIFTSCRCFQFHICFDAHIILLAIRKKNTSSNNVRCEQMWNQNENEKQNAHITLSEYIKWTNLFSARNCHFAMVLSRWFVLITFWTWIFM